MREDIKSTVEELDRIEELCRSGDQIIGGLSGLLEETEQKLDMQVADTAEGLRQFRREQAKQIPNPPAHPLASKAIPVPPKGGGAPAVGAVIGIVLIVALALFLFFSVFSRILPSALDFLSDAVVSLATFTLIAGGVAWVVAFKDSVGDFIAFQNAQGDWENTFSHFDEEKESRRFYESCAAYENGFLLAVQACEERYESELEKYGKAREEIFQSFEERERPMQEQLGEIKDQLGKVTLLHPDLFDSAGHISRLLKTGRADTLKEAINLALEEDRRQEEEAARREEARQRLELMEQQAHDQKMHNAAMEQLERDRNRAMELQAREQNRLAAEQNKIAREEARRREKAGAVTHADNIRCQACKNYGHGCHGGIHNCGAFVSKRA